MSASMPEVLTKFLAEGPTAQELAAAEKTLIDGQALRIDSNVKLRGYLSLIGFWPGTRLPRPISVQGGCNDPR